MVQKDTEEFKTEVIKEIPAKTPLVSVKKIKPDLRKKEPPMVDVKVANPVTYIKSWWNRILGNEGLDIRIKLRPLTAIAITIIVVTVAFGLGKFVFPFKIPFFQYNVDEIISPNPVFRQTGFTGELKLNRDTNKYFLITSASEAVSLTLPEKVDFSDLLGRRIFAAGKYYPDTGILVVESMEDLEILPKSAEPIPTASSTPEPTIKPTPKPTQEPIISPTSDVLVE